MCVCVCVCVCVFSDHRFDLQLQHPFAQPAVHQLLCGESDSPGGRIQDCCQDVQGQGNSLVCVCVCVCVRVRVCVCVSSREGQ